MEVLRRRIEIAVRPTGEGASEARAALEDDFHHFRVIVRQRDGEVVEALSEALRHPTPICPAAGLRLSELVGLEVNAACAAVTEVVDARQQCTHQLDLAALAVAALAQGRPHRVYDIDIPASVDRRTTATLRRDGEVVMAWEMHGESILSPEPYAGRTIGSGFTAFARTLPLDEAEAALVLRRGVFISRGRDPTFERDPTKLIGGCWARQPERWAQGSVLLQGYLRDFTADAQAPTREDQAWLTFRDPA
jgi:hypothetical protein